MIKNTYGNYDLIASVMELEKRIDALEGKKEPEAEEPKDAVPVEGAAEVGAHEEGH